MAINGQFSLVLCKEKVYKPVLNLEEKKKESINRLREALI